MRKIFFGLVAVFLLPGAASGQFFDSFDGNEASPAGWESFTGDGEATIQFIQKQDYASMVVDATKDRRLIWWAVIKREVSEALDLGLLEQPGYELRIEARVRTSHAPRRLNMSFNTQRTTDFHSHLMEYDIPDTTGWHVISMTTKDFDARPGDQVNAQIAMIDWGPDIYRTDVDYVRVDVVRADTVGPDLGTPLPYHPPAGDPETFDYHVPVAQDATIDARFPDLNFDRWSTVEQGDTVRLVAVSPTQVALLQWDLSPYRGKKVAGWGTLELTTHDLEMAPQDLEEFDKVRVHEILAGDPHWKQETVTYDGFLAGEPLFSALNSQMTIDVALASARGERTLIPISPPVLQRLLDGRTRGLALRPIGALHASLYAKEHRDGVFGAKLHFNVED